MDWLYFLLARFGINVGSTILISSALRMFEIAERKLAKASLLEKARIEIIKKKIEKLNIEIYSLNKNTEDTKDNIHWIDGKINKLREFTK